MAGRATQRSRVMTVAALIAGLLGGGWIARLFDHRAAAQPPALPSERRRLRLHLTLDIVMPDGTPLVVERWAAADAAGFAPVNVGTQWLRIRLSRTAVGAFCAETDTGAGMAAATLRTTESDDALWRLPQPDGLATLRVRLRRAYAAT